MISSEDLIAGIEHHLLRVAYVEAGTLERSEHRQFDQVDPDRSVCDARLDEEPLHLHGGGFHETRIRGDGAAEAEHPGARVGGVKPRRVEAVVFGGRSEVPQHRLAAPCQQAVAADLVAHPLADLGGGDVTDVVHVKAEQRTELGRLERRPGTGKPVGAKP